MGIRQSRRSQCLLPSAHSPHFLVLASASLRGIGHHFGSTGAERPPSLVKTGSLPAPALAAAVPEVRYSASARFRSGPWRSNAGPHRQDLPLLRSRGAGSASAAADGRPCVQLPAAHSSDRRPRNLRELLLATARRRCSAASTGHHPLPRLAAQLLRPRWAEVGEVCGRGVGWGLVCGGHGALAVFTRRRFAPLQRRGASRRAECRLRRNYGRAQLPHWLLDNGYVLNTSWRLPCCFAFQH